MPTTITELILLLAALVFLGQQAKSQIMRLVTSVADHQIRRIQAVHDEALENITTSFDLWWEDSAKPIVSKNLRAKALEELPDFITQEEAEEMLPVLLGSILKELKGAARHLALHAYMGPAEKQMLKRVPKMGNLRELVLAERAQHDRGLELTRIMLIENGIDPEELEQHFSQAS